jgi:uncharacterized protein YndB with AHSA1/START domain
VAQAGAPAVEDAFAVLAHPVRRELLHRLAHNEQRVSDLAQHLPVSRSAVSQHLRVMLTVGVVTERRAGRERLYSLQLEPLNEVQRWLTDLDAFWKRSLTRLGGAPGPGIMIDERGRVVHDVHFAHPIDRVWNALVDPDALAQWLMPNDFEPSVGRRFHFDAGPPRGRIDAEVIALEPPHRLVWRWMLDGAATTVTITLRADAEGEGAGTALHLEHTDLPTELRPRFDSGWVEKFDDLAAGLGGSS